MLISYFSQVNLKEKRPKEMDGGISLWKGWTFPFGELHQCLGSVSEWEILET